MELRFLTAGSERAGPTVRQRIIEVSLHLDSACQRPSSHAIYSFVVVQAYRTRLNPRFNRKPALVVVGG